MLHSSILLFIHPKCNSLHLLIRNFQSFPSPSPSALAAISLFSMSVSLLLSCRRFHLYWVLDPTIHFYSSWWISSLSASWNIPSPPPLFSTSTPVYLTFIFHDLVKHHLPYELFPKPTVLVDSGCSNKTPQIGWLRKSAHSFLSLLEDENSKIKTLVDSVTDKD